MAGSRRCSAFTMSRAPKAARLFVTSNRTIAPDRSSCFLATSKRRLSIWRTLSESKTFIPALPEEKLKLVSAETACHKTLFVGDGINDAPAMLAATTSIALGGRNSDVTAEAADAVVMDSSLRKVDGLMHIARRTRSIALQTAVGGIGLSGVCMLLAVTGWLPPLTGPIPQEAINLAALLTPLRAPLDNIPL